MTGAAVGRGQRELSAFLNRIQSMQNAQDSVPGAPKEKPVVNALAVCICPIRLVGLGKLGKSSDTKVREGTFLSAAQLEMGRPGLNAKNVRTDDE